MVRQRLSRQQGKFWILLCCLLAGMAYYRWPPGITMVSGSRQNNAYPSPAAVVPPAQPILPKGYGVQNSGRDLFAAPREFQLASAALPVSASAAGNFANNSQPVSQTEKKADITLRLVGVISGNGQAVAIIQKDTGSRFYRVNEYIADYQLITIAENSVTLLGPQGHKVLTLER